MLKENIRFFSVSTSVLLIACCFVTVSGQSTYNRPAIPNGVGDDGTLLVVPVEKDNAFAAYSKHTGKWSTHTFPKGIVVVPVVSGNCAVFMLVGENISEVAAVDRNGEWRTCRLNQKTNRCDPVIGSDVAAIQIGDFIYAFSATKGTWDTLSKSATTPRVYSDTVLVVTPEKISAFSAQTGAWAESPSL